MTVIRYSRRMNEYIYDIEIRDTTRLVNAQRFSARAMNIVRLATLIPVNADLPITYGPTRHEAVSTLEAAIVEWVTSQTRRRQMIRRRRTSHVLH
jgi:hypothetical protein